LGIAETNAIDNLLKASVNKRLDPFEDLPWEQGPSRDSFWLTPEVISIFGEPEYEQLSHEQRVRLSQLECCLLCSVSASGEKEVVANMARRMLKARYAPFRPYFHYFIEEENNHIRMFAEFCERHGQFYPVLYSYAQGEVWEHSEMEDLLTFVHVLIFEELGQGLNEVLMADETLPPLVRAINRYHVLDEGRHISFGRMLLREHCDSIRSLVPAAQWEKLQAHVARYLRTRHIDYHNARIYKDIGIPQARLVRDRLVERRNESFFAKSPRAAKRIDSLRRFLSETQLLPPDAVPAQAQAH